MPWFHGGKPGLATGDMLLPPSETGQATLLHYSEKCEGNTQRADRVYLTRDPKAAAFYAWGFPKGDVYEAEPIGEQEQDTDCLMPGLSLQAARARVVRVTRRSVTMGTRGKLTR